MYVFRRMRSILIYASIKKGVKMLYWYKKGGESTENISGVSYWICPHRCDWVWGRTLDYTVD